MITGAVNDSGEAVLSLEVLNNSGARETLVAVVDTGFTGFLTLPRAVVGSLSLPLLGSIRLLSLTASPSPSRSTRPW